MILNNLSNYHGKRVFVTGHTGFKGSWLIYILNQLGAEVMAYALAAEEKSLYRAMYGDQFCHSITDDIRNFDRLQSEIQNFQPDFVFHLAAQTLVRESYKEARYTFEVNSLGTANVLEAIKTVQRKCTVVVVTTDKVYDNKEWIHPYRESDQLGGYDPYSASKACAELIT